MDYRVLWGDPTQPQVWEELDRLLSMGLPHVAGHHLDISAVCIDSGYETDMVYAFCHPRLGRRIFAAKGMEGAGRPIASAPRRISLKNGKTLRLVIVGVDEAKRIVMSRLQVTEGPGRCHFPLSRDEEYFAQLTAEKKQTKFRHGHPYHIWVKTRPRNEALDIRILSMAALRLVNPRWDELADRNDRAAMAANHTPVPAPATNIPVPPSLRRRGLCQ